MVLTKHDNTRTHRGLTLVEVTLAMSLVVCSVLGALTMRFHTTRQNKRAEVYNHAVRVAEVFLESWRAETESVLFDPFSVANDPSSSEIVFDATGTASGPTVPVGLNLLNGSYHLVTFGGIFYYVTLAYQNRSATTPSLLCVGVGWQNNYKTGAFSASNPVVWLTTYD